MFVTMSSVKRHVLERHSFANVASFQVTDDTDHDVVGAQMDPAFGPQMDDDDNNGCMQAQL